MTVSNNPHPSAEHALAEAVRRACTRMLLEAYEQASFDGLCHEGAWEYALSALQTMDLQQVIRDHCDASSGKQPLSFSR